MLPTVRFEPRRQLVGGVITIKEHGETVSSTQFHIDARQVVGQRAETVAPSPLALVPWQLAQLAMYSFLPKSRLDCAKLVLLTATSAAADMNTDDWFMIHLQWPVEIHQCNACSVPF